MAAAREMEGNQSFTGWIWVDDLQARRSEVLGVPGQKALSFQIQESEAT